MLSDNSDEQRIQEIMKAKGCTRENAEKRLRSSQVAVFALNPSPKTPDIDYSYIAKIREAKKIHDVEVAEEVEESEPQPDPLLEEKRELLEQKKRIMDKLESQVDQKTVNDEIFKEYLAVPEWQELFFDYIKAYNMLIQKYADYFLMTSIRKGEKIDRDFEFYKDGKKVTVDTTFETSEGVKTVAEIIAQQEKKKEEYMKKIKYGGVATVESNQKAEDD